VYSRNPDKVTAGSLRQRFKIALYLVFLTLVSLSLDFSVCTTLYEEVFRNCGRQ
jgi:hypothetical protein